MDVRAKIAAAIHLHSNGFCWYARNRAFEIKDNVVIAHWDKGIKDDTHETVGMEYKSPPLPPLYKDTPKIIENKA